MWSGYRSWGGTATKSFWTEQVRMRSELGDLEHLVGSLRATTLNPSILSKTLASPTSTEAIIESEIAR